MSNFTIDKREYTDADLETAAKHGSIRAIRMRAGQIIRLRREIRRQVWNHDVREAELTSLINEFIQEAIA